MRWVIILLLLAQPLWAQNFFKVVRAAKGAKPIRIHRMTITSGRNFETAYRVVWEQSKKVDVSHEMERIVLQTIITQPQVSPLEVSGGYNYLRAVSQASRGLPDWKKINASDGYNGVHHIINKTVLDELYRVREKKENGLTYNDFVRNSPAAFHPLHNDLNFGWFFHNPKLQMRIYAEKGVKGVLIDYFGKANYLSKEYGFEEYTDEVIKNSLSEAKFWAEVWGLEWGE